MEGRNDMEDTNDMQGFWKKGRSGEKRSLDFRPRVKMRLSELERVIRTQRIIVPPLSRQTLIKMCEEGIFETAGTGPTIVGWLVYEDSFLKWAKSLDEG